MTPHRTPHRQTPISRPVRRPGRRAAFTLIEILIVVIILGILAAIVIPQFTSASQDARQNSTRTQVQTIRSQIELYKMEHGGLYPTDDNTDTGTWSSWDKLIKKTNDAGTVDAAGKYGPYLQSEPVNSINDNTKVKANADGDAGFVFAGGKFSATNKAMDDVIE